MNARWRAGGGRNFPRTRVAESLVPTYGEGMSAFAAALWRRLAAIVSTAACIGTIQAVATVSCTVAVAHPAGVSPALANSPTLASSFSWVFERPGFDAAWAQTVGDPSVVIAVVDTGVDPTADLQGALLPGYNFNDDNSQTDDPVGHGTEVASLIAARAGTGIGVTGACGRCSLLPVRVSGPDGSASVTTIASGIVWAADHGARVINISLVTSQPSQVLADAVTYAQRKGALIVAAAGNEGIASTDYPAALPGVLSVEATMQTDKPYTFSNHGGSVTIAAPGCAIVSTTGGSYTSACGTSVSAPLVAGAAGLLFAAHPTATADQVASALEQGADRVGDTRFGRLNVTRSLQLLGSSAATPSPRQSHASSKFARRAF